MGNQSDYIPVSVIASHRKYLYPLGRRQVTRMCENGVFKTAYKPGHGRNAKWVVLASEVIAHKINNHAQPQ